MRHQPDALFLTAVRLECDETVEMRERHHSATASAEKFFLFAPGTFRRGIILVNFTDQGLKGGTCSGNEEDQLSLDLTRDAPCDPWGCGADIGPRSGRYEAAREAATRGIRQRAGGGEDRANFNESERPSTLFGRRDQASRSNDRDRIMADRSQALLRSPVHGGRFAAVLLSAWQFRLGRGFPLPLRIPRSRSRRR